METFLPMAFGRPRLALKVRAWRQCPPGPPAKGQTQVPLSSDSGEREVTGTGRLWGQGQAGTAIPWFPLAPDPRGQPALLPGCPGDEPGPSSPGCVAQGTDGRLRAHLCLASP